MFGVAEEGFVLYHLYKPIVLDKLSEVNTEDHEDLPARGQLIARLGIFLLPFALMVFVCMAWNSQLYR